MKNSSTIIIFILFCIVHSVLSSIMTYQQTKLEADEDKWVKLYGTHKKYSGCWPLARYFRNHLDELKVFCAKAHELWTNNSVTTQEAYVNHWLITFEDTRRKPIYADMIMYSEERVRVQPQIMIYHFMIKGHRPDCVFYMNQVRRTRDDEVAEIIFREHICGITGFEEYASNKCET